MVKILIASATANHCPLQAALSYSTFQFRRRFVRSRHWKNSEASKARGMPCDARGYQIVGAPGEENTLHRLKIVQSRRCDGQHLYVYTAFVHQGQTTLSEIFKMLPNLALIEVGDSFRTDG